MGRAEEQFDKLITLDKELSQKLEQLFAGKIPLNGFRGFICINFWGLHLPLGHRVNHIRAILAEQNTYVSSIPEDEIIKILKKEILI